MVKIFILFFLTQSFVLAGQVDFYPIEKYKVIVEPHFKEKTITGSTEIIFTNFIDAELQFDLSGLVVNGVTSDKIKIKFTQTLNQLVIPKQKNKKIKSLKISYRGQPTDGLVWSNDYVLQILNPVIG